jgi:hypothetical protein
MCTCFNRIRKLLSWPPTFFIVAFLLGFWALIAERGPPWSLTFASIQYLLAWATTLCWYWPHTTRRNGSSRVTVSYAPWFIGIIGALVVNAAFIEMWTETRDAVLESRPLTPIDPRKPALPWLHHFAEFMAIGIGIQIIFIFLIATCRRIAPRLPAGTPRSKPAPELSLTAPEADRICTVLTFIWVLQLAASAPSLALIWAVVLRR